jgi:flagellar biosynthesis/type III secretory pathway chaperone
MKGYDMDNNTYVYILIDTLLKKNSLLDNLIQTTLFQKECITEETPDMDQFEQTLSEKEILIDQLNQLDDGFEVIYDHVKDEISNNKLKHKDDILKLQELIRQVTEKSTKLQALELQNKSIIEFYFANKKKEIKNFKRSSQTASNYYKNMSNQNQGESYFLDKKK